MYKLEYLPIAMQDMIEIATYISRELCNPSAAEKQSVKLIEACESLVQFPYANPVYHPIKPLKREYRKILVGHYLVFYWVDEEKKHITIARIIYAKRDYSPLLK